MFDTFSVKVPSPGGEEERTARVYIPEGRGRFPVLYLFDGQTAFFDDRAPFGDSWRMRFTRSCKNSACASWSPPSIAARSTV